jgi:hypothetical protein
MVMKPIFICAAIHSAVRVSTGEADEIAAQSFCGFCGEVLNYKLLAVYLNWIMVPEGATTSVAELFVTRTFTM